LGVPLVGERDLNVERLPRRLQVGARLHAGEPGGKVAPPDLVRRPQEAVGRGDARLVVLELSTRMDGLLARQELAAEDRAERLV
jgi:hypothetical protein